LDKEFQVSPDSLVLELCLSGWAIGFRACLLFSWIYDTKNLQNSSQSIVNYGYRQLWHDQYQICKYWYL